MIEENGLQQWSQLTHKNSHTNRVSPVFYVQRIRVLSTVPITSSFSTTLFPSPTLIGPPTETSTPEGQGDRDQDLETPSPMPQCR